MKRILIIGCAGAGKSTLARALSEKLDVPIIHLDQLYWDANWQMRESEVFTALVAKAVEGECWIMDGNYTSTMPLRLEKADMLIHLDMPRWRCLWRVFWRTIKHYRRSRADMPEGCVERFDWEFTKYIWSFNRERRPKLLRILSEVKGQRVTLRSPSDVKEFLQKLDA